MKVFQVEERKGNIRIKQVARTNIPTRLSCFNVITTIKLDDIVLFTVQYVSKKMTTPSRKLRHIAEASLTFFTKQMRLGMGQNPFFDVLLCFLGVCKVL